MSDTLLLQQARATSSRQQGESPKPIVAESIRQAGGWSGALITATAWGSYAAASTSISGPWAIVIGFAASLVGGFLGYFFSDKVADHIDENQLTMKIFTFLRTLFKSPYQYELRFFLF